MRSYLPATRCCGSRTLSARWRHASAGFVGFISLSRARACVCIYIRNTRLLYIISGAATVKRNKKKEKKHGTEEIEWSKTQKLLIRIYIARPGTNLCVCTRPETLCPSHSLCLPPSISLSHTPPRRGDDTWRWWRDGPRAETKGRPKVFFAESASELYSFASRHII